MKYLKIWTSFRDVVKPLSDAEIGRLFVAMLVYTETGVEPGKWAGNEAFLWPVAKQTIDLAAAKAEKLRENGMKGGRPAENETKDNQSKPSKTKDNQSEPNKRRNNNKEKKSNNKIININQKYIFTPPTMEEVSLYCIERQNHVDPEKFFNYYTSNGWKVGKNQMKDWKAAVRTWERSEATEREYQERNNRLLEDLPF